MSEPNNAVLFGVFNEIGIINQLTTALIEKKMQKGLTVAHFSVLNHLIRLEDGRTPVELARAFQVAKTTMTHTLSGLEKHKLVEIRPNPNDRRSKCVWLTDAGRTWRDMMIAAMDPDFAILTDGFDIGKLATMLPMLSELRTFMDNHRNGEPSRDRPVPPRP